MTLRCLALIAISCSAALNAPAQSRAPGDLAAGKLLVASRDLPDPNFAKTVVLLVKYGPDGAAGVILNRRLKIPVSTLLDRMKSAKDRSEPVFSGGPVGVEGVLALLRSHEKPDAVLHVSGEIYLLNEPGRLEKALPSSTSSTLRLYLGYAGWTQAQLQTEVDLGAWFIFRGSDNLVFDSEPDSLWPRLIRETELKVASAGRPRPLRD